MWKKILWAGVLSLALVSGCTGLKRGMAGDTYVSSAKPPFAVSVPSLPLRAAGSAIPSVTTEDSLGGIAINAWLAVYGGAPGQPMAIVAQAEIPPMWYWDSDMRRSFSVDGGTAVLDGRLFQTCTYIVDGAGDAFSSLVPVAEPDSLRWLARRFATRTDFNLGKITLEYREPLPQGFESLTNLPHGGNTFLAEFNERAEKAFVFAPVQGMASEVRTAYIEGVRIRYLNNNFFGTMSRYDIVD